MRLLYIVDSNTDTKVFNLESASSNILLRLDMTIEKALDDIGMFDSAIERQ